MPQPVLQDSHWRGETRSAWLRLVALVVLIANLAVAQEQDNILVHANLIVGYGLATLLGLAFVSVGRVPSWLPTTAVTVDAVFTVVLFHEHLFANNGLADHELSVVSVAIGFMLLTHVALRLQPRLLLRFAGGVLVGWLSLLAVTRDWEILRQELPLAAAFSFASFVCWLLVRDHNAQLERAVASDRRHRNLARFFPPTVLTELQLSSLPLALDRRRVAIMFLDLRAFTRYSETASPEDVAELVASYRELVTKVVFQHRGVIDKFLGDGIMVVFGHPRTAADDATRAFRCAMSLQAALAKWADARRLRGKPSLSAGIGLHVGVVVAGILHSASHDEFTLFGDAVNVAQRLERLCKSLDASLVISLDVAASGNLGDPALRRMFEDRVILEGRERPVDILYLPRAASEGNRKHMVQRENL